MNSRQNSGHPLTQGCKLIVRITRANHPEPRIAISHHCATHNKPTSNISLNAETIAEYVYGLVDAIAEMGPQFLGPTLAKIRRTCAN